MKYGHTLLTAEEEAPLVTQACARADALEVSVTEEPKPGGAPAMDHDTSMSKGYIIFFACSGARDASERRKGQSRDSHKASGASVFHKDDTPEWEYQKWLDGLTHAKGVLENVDLEQRVKGIAPVPSKLVLTRKPVDDDEIELKEGVGAASKETQTTTGQIRVRI